jgi:hypothetical protein
MIRRDSRGGGAGAEDPAVWSGEAARAVGQRTTGQHAN